MIIKYLNIDGLTHFLNILKNKFVEKEELHEVATTGSWNELEDRPFGESVSEECIVPETIVNISYISMADQYVSSIKQSEHIRFVEGNDYVVTWDGTRYNVTALPYHLGGGYLKFFDGLGNVNISHGGESDDFYTIEAYAGSEGDHTISIATIKEVVTTLDEQYIPETIARVSDLHQQITVDDVLSESSVNPVQNQVVSAAISNLNESLENKANKDELADIAMTGDWNDLNNKPFGEAKELAIIIPETSAVVSNYTGLIMENGSPFTIGETYKVTIDGVSYEVVAQNDMASGEPTLIADGKSIFYDRYATNVGVKGYVIGCGIDGTYTVKVEGYLNSIIPLDEKYISDTIARTENLHKVAITGSWNDLEDRPFYEINEIGSILDEVSITATNNITKVCDFNEEIIIGNTYKVTHNDVEYEIVANSNHLGDMNPYFTDDISYGYTYPFYVKGGTGVYVYESGEHTIKIECVVQEVKKIDSKFLPNLDEVFRITFYRSSNFELECDTPFEDIESAYSMGKTLVAIFEENKVSCNYMYYGNDFVFSFVYLNKDMADDQRLYLYEIHISSNGLISTYNHTINNVNSLSSDITTLKTNVGNLPVSTQITNAIEQNIVPITNDEIDQICI